MRSATRLRARLAKIVVGNPKVEGVRMGALASMDQHRDVSERVEMLARGNEVLFSERDGFKPVGEGCAAGAFFSPTLLLCRERHAQRRRARHRSLRPGQHHDELQRHRRSAGTWPRAARAAW
jgi:acyl-CoA reductase-like NAD-dependent aldehyde dehydrogenase